MNRKWLAPAGLAATLMIAACGSSGSSTSSGSTSSAAAPASSAAASSTLKTTKIGGVAVLTNAKGFTLYWFVPDTDHVTLQRLVRHVLAAGQGTGHRRCRRHRQARHHHAFRRLTAGDLQRASALHLRR